MSLLWSCGSSKLRRDCQRGILACVAWCGVGGVKRGYSDYPDNVLVAQMGVFDMLNGGGG